MRFTAAQVAASLADRSSRFRDAAITPDQLARTVTAGLRKLVEEVTDADEERLAVYRVVDNATVIADPLTVDLTLAGTLDWLSIQDVTWRSSTDPAGEFENQIVLTPNESRLRARGEFVHLREPLAYYADGYTNLYKMSAGDGVGMGTSWSDVDELQLFGVLIPDLITPQSGMNTLLQYPRPVMEALIWWTLLTLSGAINAADGDRAWWAAQYSSELTSIGVEARLATWTAEGIGHLDPNI